MRLEGIRAGDIVEVDRLGRRFHALVSGSAEGGLSIEPIDRRVTYRTCRPHEVRAHWAKRGRPRQTGGPRERPPREPLERTPREPLERTPREPLERPPREPLERTPLQLELDTRVSDARETALE